MELYIGVESDSFGNCYRSALGAGFSDQTARSLTHNKPRWYSEILGQNEGLQPEHLVIKLTDIVNDPNEATRNKLKAIDMLMKHKSMYPAQNNHMLQLNKINIESIL